MKLVGAPDLPKNSKKTILEVVRNLHHGTLIQGLSNGCVYMIVSGSGVVVKYCMVSLADHNSGFAFEITNDVDLFDDFYRVLTDAILIEGDKFDYSNCKAVTS